MSEEAKPIVEDPKTEEPKEEEVPAKPACKKSCCLVNFFTKKEVILTGAAIGVAAAACVAYAILKKKK